ncbi:MAG: replication-associated recombination protein A [Acidimicrobiia bacterium]|nr:replication-associated recombination protein A [Acidimicrobiia bacterium]
MADNLFAAAAEERLKARSPLASRLRPSTLDDVVGQDHLLGPAGPLRRLVEMDRLSSVILWGPPGTGKTTLARLIATASSKQFVQLSAVNASVKDVREVIADAEHVLGAHGRGTILFLDEVHRFNKAQQDRLLPAVESGVLVLIGATTENPFFEVNAPLRSRSTLFRLNPLEAPAIDQLLRRGLEAERATATDEAIGHLANNASGDGRQALTTLEVAIALAAAEAAADETGDTGSGIPEALAHVDLAHAEAATDLKSLRYGRDEHYDITSAFIKSMRGSDPDAALYWLARMLAAGEDPRFIARRLVIFASEDVGLADHRALLVANAAAQAVEFVGLPEARINLAHATVHLAAAPKSNSAYAGLNLAMADVNELPVGEVPMHLRDGSYQGAASLGHGQAYRYPHDDPSGWVPQHHRPDHLADRIYYTPKSHGEEAEIIARFGPAEAVEVRSQTRRADGPEDGSS